MWFLDPRSGDARRAKAKAKVRDVRHVADRFEQVAERVSAKVRHRDDDLVDIADVDEDAAEDPDLVLLVTVPLGSDEASPAPHSPVI